MICQFIIRLKAHMIYSFKNEIEMEMKMLISHKYLSISLRFPVQNFRRRPDDSQQSHPVAGSFGMLAIAEDGGEMGLLDSSFCPTSSEKKSES